MRVCVCVCVGWRYHTPSHTGLRRVVLEAGAGKIGFIVRSKDAAYTANLCAALSNVLV